MFCSKCGAAATAESRFCQRCGTELPSDTAAADGNVYQVSAASMAPPAPVSANAYYEAVIGPKNQAHYLRHFAAFDAAGKPGATWHWPAFFFTFYWFLYRKMWLQALTYFFLPYIFLFVAGIIAGVASAGSSTGAVGIIGLAYVVYALGIFIIPPMYANAMYYKHCRKKIAEVVAGSPDPQRQLGELAARGGTSNIVLIIVLIFGFFFGIGILAAIAIPAYQNYIARSQTAEAISLIQGLKAPVEQYYSSNGSCPDNSTDAAGSIPVASSISGTFVDSVTTSASPCTITATMKKTGVAHAVAGGNIVLEMQSDGIGGTSWVCTSPDIAQQYLPKSCQGAAQQ